MIRKICLFALLWMNCLSLGGHETIDSKLEAKIDSLVDLRLQKQLKRVDSIYLTVKDRLAHINNIYADTEYEVAGIERIEDELNQKIETVTAFNKRYRHFDDEYKKLDWGYGLMRTVITILALFLTGLTIFFTVINYFNYNKQKELKEIANKNINEIKQEKREFEKFVTERNKSIQKMIGKLKKTRSEMEDFVASKKALEVANSDIKKVTRVTDIKRIPKEYKQLFRDFKNKFNKLNSTNKHFEYDSNDYYVLGLADFYDGFYDKAIENFEQALQKGHIDKAEVSSKIGASLYKLGHTEKALLKLEKALDINPSLDAALYNKGVILKAKAKNEKGEMQTKIYKNALIVFEKVLSINPSHILAKNNKGLVLIALGKYEEGVIVLNEITEHDKDFELAHYNLAVIYTYIVELRSITKAFYHLEEALKIEPIKRAAKAINDSELNYLRNIDKDKFTQLILKYALNALNKKS